jgi:hypothetical protein
MIRRGALLAAAVALCIGNAAQAAAVATSATVTATATYQADTSGVQTQFHGDPGAASVSANAGPGASAFTLDQGGEVFDGAIARARSELDSSLQASSVGVYSHAGGYSPGFASPPNGVEASSSVRWMLNFIVHSLPEITTAQLNAELGIDGSLVAAAFGGASGVGQVYASVGVRLGTISSLGTDTWIDASATLDRFGGLSVSGPWASGFNLMTPPGSSAAYAEALYNETYIGLVTVPTNEVFTYEIELNSEAFVHGAFENWAVADFFNTATFDLSVSTPGLSLERLPAAVPLPAPVGMLLVSIAVLGIRGARRRSIAPR